MHSRTIIRMTANTTYPASCGPPLGGLHGQRSRHRLLLVAHQAVWRVPHCHGIAPSWHSSFPNLIESCWLLASVGYGFDDYQSISERKKNLTMFPTWRRRVGLPCTEQSFICLCLNICREWLVQNACVPRLVDQLFGRGFPI